MKHEPGGVVAIEEFIELKPMAYDDVLKTYD